MSTKQSHMRKKMGIAPQQQAPKPVNIQCGVVAPGVVGVQFSQSINHLTFTVAEAEALAKNLVEMSKASVQASS